MQTRYLRFIVFILAIGASAPLCAFAQEDGPRRENPPGPTGGAGFGNVPGPAGGPGAGPRFNGNGHNPPGTMGGGPGFGNPRGPMGGPGEGPRFGNENGFGGGKDNPPGPVGGAGTDWKNSENPQAEPSNEGGMGPLKRRQAREKFKADRNGDGMVDEVERNEAKNVMPQRFGEKAQNSTGEPTGKPAWMDNNPLTSPTGGEEAGRGMNNPPGPRGGPGFGNRPPGGMGDRMNPPGPMGGPGEGRPGPGPERRRNS